MKTILITYLFLFCFLLTGKAQIQQEVSYFPLLRSLVGSEMCIRDSLREAGLTPKAPSYTNWENTGLDGHIGGHYISALSMMYAATGLSLIHI